MSCSELTPFIKNLNTCGIVINFVILWPPLKFMYGIYIIYEFLGIASARAVNKLLVQLLKYP